MGDVVPESYGGDDTLSQESQVVACQHCAFSFVMPKHPEGWYQHCPECGERILPVLDAEL
jgi:DNA-directed RNA polymerase subunit RPC12/RpoP